MIKFSPKINIREEKKKKPKKSIYIHNKPSRQFVSAEVTMRWVVLACSWSGSWRCPDCQDWLFTLLQSLFPLYEMCPKAVFLYLLQAKSIQKLSSTSIIEKRVHVFKQTVIFQATNYITIQRACRKIFPECYAKKSKKTIYASQFKRIHSNLFTCMRLQLRHDNILLGTS